MTTVGNGPRAAFRRALVVDDEGGLLLLVRAILEHGSFLVDVARDGLEACARVGTATYDAIICDIRMPNMDGPTFYNRLTEIDAQQAKRVIFVTGLDLDSQTRDELRRSGCPVLHKPFEIDRFAWVVKQVAGDA